MSCTRVVTSRLRSLSRLCHAAIIEFCIGNFKFCVQLVRCLSFMPPPRSILEHLDRH